MHVLVFLFSMLYKHACTEDLGEKEKKGVDREILLVYAELVIIYNK